MTPLLRVRRMRWWDIAVLAPVEAELFPADPWSPGLFWGELAGVPSRRYYVVAEHASAGLVGYAGLASSGVTADVQTLAVRPDAQGRGVGARLLTDLLAEATRRGCGSVLLEVRADNAGAQRLYARHGFTRIGVRRGYYDGGTVDALVLRRRAPVAP